MVEQERFHYDVEWSEEDREFIGLCAEFPSLSWCGKTQEAAFQGICTLVADVVRDLGKGQ